MLNELEETAVHEPRRYHLDKRAAQIAAAIPPIDDELLSSKQLALFLGVNEQWLQKRRRNGTGPAWFALSPRRIKYKKSDVVAWLQTRINVRAA